MMIILKIKNNLKISDFYGFLYRQKIVSDIK